MTAIPVSFVVPTRMRMEQVVALLRSIAAQTIPAETLIMDDAGSADLQHVLARDFPSVRYHCVATGRGPAFQRNRGIEMAAGEIVFPLDDDTRLPSPRTVAQTLADFSDRRVAAVAVPYVNVRGDDRIRHRAPDTDAIWVEHAFTGASHAIRRAAFLAAGGYREHFFYMGEEGDLCLRLLALGYVVRAGTADPIHHFESPLRDSALADFCGRRNDILFAWHNVPARSLPIHLAGTTWNGFISALQASHRWSALKGMLDGYAQIPTRWNARCPVTTRTYQLHRLLKKRGPVRLDAIRSALPPQTC
jgi:GT2 family glycosyltransferase